MANLIRLKRASGSDPAASDLVSGEPAVRTDTGELFFKKDDGSVAKVSGAGGGPDFKYLALRNAANNGAASYPNADFTLVTSGTTNALTPTAANTLLVSVNGVIQKPNTGTSTPSSGFALSGSTIKFGGNISAAPDFILYQESGGIGEPSDATVSEAKLNVSNNPVNGYFLSAQSGNTGGLTWAAPVATSCTGNSATATALATARAINGVNFDGTAAITVTAAAGTLSGNTLNSSVTASSLTSLGDLAGLTVDGDATFTGANYNVLWDKSDNALEFADNAKAVFGAGNDLQIYHDGSNSYIEDAGTGSLILKSNHLIANAAAYSFMNAANSETLIYAVENGAVELYYDGSLKANTRSDGFEIKQHLTMGDSDEIRLGNSSDLQIYHDGSHSYIQETGTGHLKIKTGSIISLQKIAGTSLADFNVDGSVDLYHNGSKKFETLSTGAAVTGELDVSGTIDMNTDTGRLKIGAGDDLQIYHDGTNSYIANNGGQLRIWAKTDGYAMIAVPDAQVELYHNNSKKFETVTGGATITGVCTATSFAGDGSSLTGISAGATGGGNDEVFYENSTTVTTSYSITSNKNAMSAGPISINSGAVVTIPSGSVWTIV